MYFLWLIVDPKFEYQYNENEFRRRKAETQGHGATYEKKALRSWIYRPPIRNMFNFPYEYLSKSFQRRVKNYG